jgi:arginine decarboxylase
MSKKSWSIKNALELYNVEGWGMGYFGINEEGRLAVHPDKDPARSLDLYDLALDLHQQGVGLPLLIRFSDILKSRIETLAESFNVAIQETGYGNGYTAVYPIKVNQQRHLIQEVVEFGRSVGVGLEAGSKPELQAVLALTEDTSHIIVCNGYKDEEYMRLALMGQKLGHRVYIVLEMVQEVDVLIKVAREMGVTPTAGVRVKLASTGAGRWAESAGEKSKFGMNAPQLVRVLDKLRAADYLDVLKLIHFHLGSQIPDIRTIKSALAEVARYYVELRGVGVDITHVDVGGGLGVDYDGSRSGRASSTNYSLQEYANDIVYTLNEVCVENDLPAPHILTESGRALTAHHAMLLINVIDVESQQVAPDVPVDPENDHPVLVTLQESLGEVSTRSLREVYHDAIFAKERARDLFNSGVLNLRDLARAEQLYLKILDAVLHFADPQAHEDIAVEVLETLTDRYFLNFSLFQSLPDSWAIDHLFPIMPVHRLDEEPTRRGTLQDITCDSDGRIDTFVGGRRMKRTLELHPLRPGEPYILGVFLTGAYQEILGDLHNLFGDTNAIHIRLRNGGYEITDVVHGNTVTEVLEYVQFHPSDLVATFRRKVARAQGLTREEANTFIADFMEGLDGYTYLESPLELEEEDETAIEPEAPDTAAAERSSGAPSPTGSRGSGDGGGEDARPRGNGAEVETRKR